MSTRPPGPVLRQTTAAAAMAAALLAGSTACSGDEEAARDKEGASATPTPRADPSTTDTSGAGSYSAFSPEDYVYRLEVICYCPQVGAVRVEVVDGKVASARTTAGGRGVKKGAEAPDFARLTINEIITIANNPGAGSVEVTWPDGQDHPSVVEVDRLPNATDDEVTYAIRNVRLQ